MSEGGPVVTRALVRDEEEPLGVDGLPAIVFDELDIGLDDAEASEIGGDVALAQLSVIDVSDEREGPEGASSDPLIDASSAQSISWIQPQPDEEQATDDIELVELRQASGADDVEGPDDSAIVLGAAPPLDRSEDDSDGPAAVAEPDVVALGGAPFAFSLRESAVCSFVVITDRDAEALERERRDVLRRDDGDDRASRQRGGPSLAIASVRAGETLAFSFERAAGKVSFDGGERFADARWLDGATALAATERFVFAAVYDSAVDRCTIVRGRGEKVERVADLHRALAAVVDDDYGIAVRSLVALDPLGNRLLVRLATMSVVLSISPTDQTSTT